jgi:hypothetical protein
METIEKGCMTCKSMATHKDCGQCSGTDYCLGTCAEVDANGGKYLYKNWKESNPEEQMNELKNMEKSGERSIVIGGQGEAEVNVKNTPQETLEELCRVAEACGYSVSRGYWQDWKKEINVVNHGHYRLTYYSDKLDSITKIIERSVWTA